MNRIVVILLCLMFCTALCAAEALYAFGRGQSMGRSAPSHRSPPAMHHSAPAVRSSPQTHKTQPKSNVTKTQPKSNVTKTQPKSNVAKTQPKSNIAKTQPKSNVAKNQLSKQLAEHGLKKAGNMGKSNVYKGKGPPPGKKNLAARKVPPQGLGPGGKPWNGRNRWGMFRGRWWPYFALIGGGWWLWNEGSWMTVDDGPEAVYIDETEPVVVTQQTVVQPTEVVTPVSEVTEVPDETLPICCVNRECKITRDEDSCLQQGGFTANSCPDCK